MSTAPLPKSMVENLVENFGKDMRRWPQEVQDLFDTTIEAENVSVPLSGKIDKFLNTDFHYHFAFDRADNHERVEGMRWAGWEPATTDDVVMCVESSVCNRDKNRKGRDGKGFSNEIRSGDRLLMKLPMMKWRVNRKAQNLAALQMSYPQAFGAIGKTMSATDLVQGVRSEMLIDDAAINEMRRAANSGNSVLAQKPTKE